MRMFLCPSGKQSYADASSAWARLCEIRNEVRRTERTYNLRRRCPRRIYQCPDCGLWHLTSADRMVSP